MHIEQALAGVPRDQRCRCAEKGAGAAQKADGQPSGSWWSRMFQ
jgi:hypothetical protein